ncbi:MAG: heavy metal-associated domain-containing protein, partial [Candidatus Peribacteraceae bacterium]
MSNTVPNERHVTVRIEGMHCGSCEILLERKLRAVQGVKRVSIHHKTGIAKIVADADCPPSPEDIRSTIENAGYRLRLL